MSITIGLHDRYELVFHSSKDYLNPFSDVDINAVFIHESGRRISLPGFWNGANEWKIRFSPDRTGIWKYYVSCSDPDNGSLAGDGAIVCEYREPRTELEKHGYVKIGDGGRIMTYEDGTPFFWLGDTHWQMPDCERLHECNYPGCTCGNQFRHLADDRIRKGFTVYQTYFDSAESDGGGNRRVHHWWKDKYTLINPAAFNETMDIMIEYLASQGIMVAMGFGVHSCSVRAYGFDTKPLLAFVRYCVARYACYPVCWITAQEITDGSFSYFEPWRKAGEEVSRIDGYHRPNGAHTYPLYADNPVMQVLHKEPWHDFYPLQAGHGGKSGLQDRSFYASYRNTNNKPYIESECQYEEIHCCGFTGSDASRCGAWRAMLSGAAGFTYGVTGVWAFQWNDTDDRGWHTYSPDPWYLGMDKHGSTEMTYLRQFFEYVGWSELEPEFGDRFGRFDNASAVAVAHRNLDVVVYYFTSDDCITGTATGLGTCVRYQARWYDPVNGAFIDIPSFESSDGCWTIPPRPSDRDWALLLNTSDLGDYRVETWPEIGIPATADDVKQGSPCPINSISVTSSEDGHGPEKLTDGSQDTTWRPQDCASSQTIIADLGEPKSLGWLRFSCVNEKYQDIQIRIYGSSDRNNWSILKERNFGHAGAGGSSPVYIESLSGFFRYLKIFILLKDPSEKIELSELSLFEE